MTVSSYLKNTADNAIVRDFEKKSIQSSINTIDSRLKAYFGSDEVREKFIFGSYTRNTILPRNIDERSDIDYMIVFKDDDSTPQTFLNRLKRFVEKYYSRSEIKQSHPTIQLNLDHITFELVPALKNFWSSYKIPTKNYSGQDWIDTNPNDFNENLVEKNKAHDSLIKPTIRLIKYWNAQNGYIYDSFSLEKWIVDRNFRGFSMFHTPDLKKYFYQCIEEIGKSGLAEMNKIKVDRAKNIIIDVKKLEADGYPLAAEDKIKKLLPPTAGLRNLANILQGII
jgi:predicted nucleotidyltransferase